MVTVSKINYSYVQLKSSMKLSGFVTLDKIGKNTAVKLDVVVRVLMTLFFTLYVHKRI